MALRFTQGLSQGPLFPSFFYMSSHWFPLPERGRLMTMVQVGSTAGTIVGYPLGGVIASALGWEYVFYTTGAVGLAWFAVFAVFGRESAETHPGISEVNNAQS